MKRGIALLCCAFLAVAAAPADAKKKKKKPIKLGPVVTATVASPVVSSAEGTATATCPAGKGAVGGGFLAPVSLGNSVVVHSSYMSSPTAWTVVGRSFGGTGPITSTVYCRNTSRAAVADIATAVTVPGDPQASRSLTPTCPGKSRLIAGGFESTTGANSGDTLLLRTSMATSATTWTVTALNLESSTPENLIAHAYCVKGISPATLVTTTNSTLAVQGTVLDATTGACPVAKQPKKKGKKKRKKKPPQLMSAGGFSTPVVTGAVPQAVVGTSMLQSATWTGHIINATNGVGTITLTVQGLCV